MRGKVVAVTCDVFVVKLGDNLYSIIELPAKTDIRDIYSEFNVEVFDEIQGELMTEGPVEICNLTKRNEILCQVMGKSASGEETRTC